MELTPPATDERGIELDAFSLTPVAEAFQQLASSCPTG